MENTQKLLNELINYKCFGDGESLNDIFIGISNSLLAITEKVDGLAQQVDYLRDQVERLEEQ